MIIDSLVWKYHILKAINKPIYQEIAQEIKEEIHLTHDEMVRDSYHQEVEK